MTPRLKSQNCKFFTTPLSHNSQKRLGLKENQTEYRKMTRKPGSHVRILKRVYRTWAVVREKCADSSTFVYSKNTKPRKMQQYLQQSLEDCS